MSSSRRRQSKRRIGRNNRRRTTVKRRNNRRKRMCGGMGEHKRLIHFGCWNRTAEDGYIKMIPMLKEYISSTPTDTVLVAGDNYYPKKTKDKATGEKVKTINATDLNNGFAALKDAVGAVPTYVILGNHDVEKINGECAIAELQSSQSSPPQFDIQLFKTFRWTENTVVVMFDTTLYEDPEDVDFECYSNWNKDADELARLIGKQRDAILSFLISNRTSYKNVIMVGHFPIISAKQKTKEGKSNTKFELNRFANDLILEICKAVGADKKLVYLCADVHMYQKGQIQLTVDGTVYEIDQYVVGTGGAELDEIPTKNTGDIENNDNNLLISYTIEQSVAKNGFLVCNETLDGELNLEFIN